MAGISFLEDHRTWVLTGESSTYALRLNEDDVPTHVYWGPALSDGDLPEVIGKTLPWWDGFNDPNEGLDELAADGGTRYWTPALQVRFADGTRGLEWRYQNHTITGGHLELAFTDRHYPLRITLHYRLRADVLERWTELTADTDVEVVRADSATWALPVLDDYRLSHVTGRWAAETQLQREPVPHGETVFASRRGITGHHANPWVMVDDGTATEHHGEVYGVALAWSGSWRLTTTRSSTGRLTVSGGFGQDGVVHRVGPGRPLTTPVIAGLYTRGGFGAASRAWHAYVLNHVLPHPEELRPVLYNSWEATGFDVSEAGQRALAERAAALGVELFVMDDGWFGARTGDHAGLGDWHVNRERFPDGLAPLVDAVHGLGMRFGIWVEPEMVNPDSDLYRAHPDWVLHHPHRRRSELRNQLVLNFARPDVAAWAHDWLDRLVGEHGVDFLKWDMNRPFSEAGWPGAADPDRLWVDHTRAVYTLLDRLRADHPGLRIESCAGGGGRADLGVLARTDQVWTSDNTDCARPAADPARVRPALPGPHDVGLGDRQPELRHRPVGAAAVPLPRRHGRRARHRRRHRALAGRGPRARPRDDQAVPGHPAGGAARRAVPAAAAVRRRARRAAVRAGRPGGRLRLPAGRALRRAGPSAAARRPRSRSPVPGSGFRADAQRRRAPRARTAPRPPDRRLRQHGRPTEPDSRLKIRSIDPSEATSTEFDA